MRVPTSQPQVAPAGPRSVSEPTRPSPDAWGASGFRAANALAAQIVTDETRKANQRAVDEAVRTYRDTSTSLFYGPQGEDGVPLRYTTGEAFFGKATAAQQAMAKRRQEIFKGLNGVQQEAARAHFDDIDAQFDSHLSQAEGSVRRDLYRNTYAAGQESLLSAMQAQASDPQQTTALNGTYDFGVFDRAVASLAAESYRYSEDHGDILGLPVEQWRQMEDEAIRSKAAGAFLEAVMASGDDQKAAAFVEQYGEMLAPAERKRVQGMVDEATKLGGFQRYMTDVSVRYPFILGDAEYGRGIAEEMGVEYASPSEMIERRVSAWRGTVEDAGLDAATRKEGEEYIRRQSAIELSNLRDQQEERTLELMDALDGMGGDITRLVKERLPEWSSLSVEQRDRIQKRANGYTQQETEAAMAMFLGMSRDAPEDLADLDASYILSLLPPDKAKEVFGYQDQINKTGGILTKKWYVAAALADANIKDDSPAGRSVYRQMDDWLRRNGGEDAVSTEAVEKKTNELLAVVTDGGWFGSEKRGFEVSQRDLTIYELRSIPQDDLALLKGELLRSGGIGPGMTEEEMAEVLIEAYGDLLEMRRE